jgi:hypothetical protein
MDTSGQPHAPAALIPEKEPPVPTRQEAGWAPKPVRTLWRYLYPAGIQTPERPASLVTRLGYATPDPIQNIIYLFIHSFIYLWQSSKTTNLSSYIPGTVIIEG